MAETAFERRRRRVRFKIKRLAPEGSFRLCVILSNRHLQAQVIQDSAHKTVASVFTGEKAFVTWAKNTSDASKTWTQEAGRILAERMKTAGIEKVILDRGGRKYHGNMKRFADAVRAAGIQF